MLPQKTFLTKQYQVDESFFDGQVAKVSQVMRCLEDIAKQHATSLGFGFDDMLKHNLLWVISKAKITFCKPLTKQTTALAVTTWPVKNRRFFCDRYFVAYDQNGEMLFTAVYLWLMIDKDSRQIASQKQVEFAYVADFDVATLDNTFTKVVFDKNTWQQTSVVTIQNHHLDVNNHVNNTFYMDFATANAAVSATEVEISYQHELFEGDTLTLYVKREGNQTLVCGKKLDGTVSFTARYC